MTNHDEMKEFWENCPEEFAHVTIEDDQELVANVNWNHAFLNQLHNIHNLSFCKVVDYGCGGGQLGKHMHERFEIDEYIGLDIAYRQLEAAEIYLRKYNIALMNIAHQAPLDYTLRFSEVVADDFAKIKADVFICQATMQHFPSLGYLDDFLENVNYSGIDTVVLQYRYNGDTVILNDNYKDVKDVCFKCYTTKEYIAEELFNYKTMWVSQLLPSIQGQYIILQLK